VLSRSAHHVALSNLAKLIARRGGRSSIRPSAPPAEPWSPAGFDRPFAPPPPAALFIAREVPLFAEADFEEDQQQSSGESGR